MAAGRGDLDGPPDLELTFDVSEIWSLRRPHEQERVGRRWQGEIACVAGEKT